MSYGYNVHNQQTIISAMLQDGEMRDKILAQCGEDDFDDEYRAIYKAVRRCKKADIEDIDIEILFTHSENDIGERDFVRDILIMDVPENLDHHIRVLKDDSFSEKTADKLEEVAEDFRDPSIEIYKCLSKLKEIANSYTSPSSLLLRGNQIEEEFRKKELKKFVPTGMTFMDQLLKPFGLSGGLMTFVLARPKVGKSMLILEWVKRILLYTDLNISVWPLEVGYKRFLTMLGCSMLEMSLAEAADRRKNRLLDDYVKEYLASGRFSVLKSNPFVKMRSVDDVMSLTEEYYSDGHHDVIVQDLWKNKLLGVKQDPSVLSAALAREHELLEEYDTHGIIVHHINRNIGLDRPKMDFIKGFSAEEIVDNAIGLYREKLHKRHMIDNLLEVFLVASRYGDPSQVYEGVFRPEVCSVSPFRKCDPDRIEKPKFAERKR